MEPMRTDSQNIDEDFEDFDASIYKTLTETDHQDLENVCHEFRKKIIQNHYIRNPSPNREQRIIPFNRNVKKLNCTHQILIIKNYISNRHSYRDKVSDLLFIYHPLIKIHEKALSLIELNHGLLQVETSLIFLLGSLFDSDSSLNKNGLPPELCKVIYSMKVW